MGKIYQDLEPKEAHTIMDWADQLGIDYDVWNAGESFTGKDQHIELGMAQYAWDRWESR